MINKKEFLSDIKSKGLSSPVGIYWDKFHKFLLRASKVDDQDKLLNPLILGGDIASHSVKYERLDEQLEWAIRHKCIDEAIDYLVKLPQSNWNISNGND